MHTKQNWLECSSPYTSPLFYRLPKNIQDDKGHQSSGALYLKPSFVQNMWTVDISKAPFEIKTKNLVKHERAPKLWCPIIPPIDSLASKNWCPSMPEKAFWFYLKNLLKKYEFSFSVFVYNTKHWQRIGLSWAITRNPPKKGGPTSKKCDPPPKVWTNLQKV